MEFNPYFPNSVQPVKYLTTVSDYIKHHYDLEERKMIRSTFGKLVAYVCRFRQKMSPTLFESSHQVNKTLILN